MQAIEPIIFLFGAAIIAALSSWITSIYWSRKNKGQYTRGWNAAREFTARELHDRIAR